MQRAEDLQILLKPISHDDAVPSCSNSSEKNTIGKKLFLFYHYIYIASSIF